MNMEKQLRCKTHQSLSERLSFRRLTAGTLLSVFLASGMLSGCADDLMNPIPTIEINPGFATPGFSDVTLVSLNETTVHKMVYSRVYGISRELTMTLTADEAALSAYNTANGTSYKLLPAEFYSMKDTVKFDVKSKNADFEVTIKSKQLYQTAGSISAASQYVLPIKAVTEEDYVDTNEEVNVALLHINMLPVTVSTTIPEAPVGVFFLEESAIIETRAIDATLNFTGDLPDVISIAVDPSAPMLDQPGYRLLPESNYSFGEVTREGNSLAANIRFNADGLTGEYTYLLPCRLQSSHADYVISQQEPVYFAVNITNVELTVAGANEFESVKAYSNLKPVNGVVKVSANITLPEAITINMKYDPSLIAKFNSNNNTNFKTLPESLNPKITNGKIAAGTKEIDIPYEIDVTKLAFGDYYLVPLVLQTADLENGDVAGSEVVYLNVARSLVGEYTLEVITKGRNRNVVNTIFEATDCERAGGDAWNAAIAQSQFGFGGDGNYYAVLFSVTDKDMEGKPNCKQIEIYTFLELLVKTGGTNDVSNNRSYYNTVTGEIYIDCNLFENYFNATYKETYSFKVK